MQLLGETYNDEGAAVVLHDWLDQIRLALCQLEHKTVKDKEILIFFYTEYHNLIQY